MIDFTNKKYLKMKQDLKYAEKVSPMLARDEMVIDSYKSMRDGVVFTNKRLISINVQGLSGKKVDYTSIPYKKIGMYSVETSGMLDLDSELQIAVSGVSGIISFEFKGRTKIVEIARVISEAI
jgi:hypothetical protein